jgi:hypothetical protein
MARLSGGVMGNVVVGTSHNTYVDIETDVLSHDIGAMTSREFKRWLAKHGKGRELGAGLVNAIKKQLGLD